MPIMYVLGPEGTHSHEAAAILAERIPNVEIRFCARNWEVLECVAEEGCYGTVPIDNASAGLVNDVVRDFWMRRGPDCSVHVIGDVHLPIEHCLLVQRHVSDAASVSNVLSHPHALAQCGRLIEKNRWTAIPTKSTADAACRLASDLSLDASQTAVIASRFAAERYGLRILQENVCDMSGNATQFHLLGPNGSAPTGRDKTPIIFRLEDKAGALLRVLQVISGIGVNMSSLRSISLGVRGDFAFYCELECHQDDERGKPILDGIRTFLPSLQVLGSYGVSA